LYFWIRIYEVNGARTVTEFMGHHHGDENCQCVRVLSNMAKPVHSRRVFHILDVPHLYEFHAFCDVRVRGDRRIRDMVNAVTLVICVYDRVDFSGCRERQ